MFAKAVLGEGISHMYGTSLPSATLFTDLDELRLGDHFTVTVLDRKISYEVDAIHIVKTDSSKYLKIVKGRDYCTLLTCTPYGINTKRLLIRGVRVKNPAEKTKDALHLPLKKVVYYCVVALMFLLVLIWLGRLLKEHRQESLK